MGTQTDHEKCVWTFCLHPLKQSAEYIIDQDGWGAHPLREIWGGLKEMTPPGGAVASEKGDK